MRTGHREQRRINSSLGSPSSCSHLCLPTDMLVLAEWDPGSCQGQSQLFSNMFPMLWRQDWEPPTPGAILRDQGSGPEQAVCVGFTLVSQFAWTVLTVPKAIVLLFIMNHIRLIAPFKKLKIIYLLCCHPRLILSNADLHTVTRIWNKY